MSTYALSTLLDLDPGFNAAYQTVTSVGSNNQSDPANCDAEGALGPTNIAYDQAVAAGTTPLPIWYADSEKTLPRAIRKMAQLNDYSSWPLYSPQWNWIKTHPLTASYDPLHGSEILLQELSRCLVTLTDLNTEPTPGFRAELLSYLNTWCAWRFGAPQWQQDMASFSEYFGYGHRRGLLAQIIENMRRITGNPTLYAPQLADVLTAPGQHVPALPTDTSGAGLLNNQLGTAPNPAGCMQYPVANGTDPATGLPIVYSGLLQLPGAAVPNGGIVSEAFSVDGAWVETNSNPVPPISSFDPSYQMVTQDCACLIADLDPAYAAQLDPMIVKSALLEMSRQNSDGSINTTGASRVSVSGEIARSGEEKPMDYYQLLMAQLEAAYRLAASNPVQAAAIYASGINAMISQGRIHATYSTALPAAALAYVAPTVPVAPNIAPTSTTAAVRFTLTRN